MDKDRVVRSAKEIKGAVKHVAGNSVGDAKLEFGRQGRQDRGQGSERRRRRQRRAQTRLRASFLAIENFVPFNPAATVSTRLR